MRKGVQKTVNQIAESEEWQKIVGKLKCCKCIVSLCRPVVGFHHSRQVECARSASITGSRASLPSQFLVQEGLVCLTWKLPVHARQAPPYGSRFRDRSNSERELLDHLFSVTYEELRRLASSVRRGDPSATLSPTALVNEAWLKLIRSQDLVPSSRLHFKRIAARAMRQLLVEAARRRHSDKRGGEDAVFVTLDESVAGTARNGKEVLALDAALNELSRLHPRQAMLVESRFFGGFEVTEIAAMLGHFRSYCIARLAGSEGLVEPRCTRYGLNRTVEVEYG